MCGGGGGGGYSDISIHRLGPFLEVQDFKFQYFFVGGGGSERYILFGYAAKIKMALFRDHICAF